MKRDAEGEMRKRGDGGGCGEEKISSLTANKPMTDRGAFFLFVFLSSSRMIFHAGLEQRLVDLPECHKCLFYTIHTDTYIYIDLDTVLAEVHRKESQWATLGAA